MKTSGVILGERLLRLAVRMNSSNGITIPQIMEEFEVSRATAFRMKKSVVDALRGRTAFEAEPPDEEEDDRFTWGNKKRGGRGRDWTYKIYDDQFVFNDVGTDTLAALEVAEGRLRTEGLFQAADELLGLINQVQDRLTTRQEARTTAESLLEASGAALRVQPRVQAPSGLLGALQAAIVARRPIRFRYYLRRDRKYRTYRVDPLGIIFHRFAYLVCINHKARRGGPRTFRISEIDRVEELPEQFLPPKNFQLDEFVQQSFGVYHGGEPLDVIWRFKASVAEEAEKFQFHPNQTLEKQSDGSLLVKFSAKGDVEMCWELFTWGNDVEIVAPQSLKDTFSELVDDLNNAAENLVS